MIILIFLLFIVGMVLIVIETITPHGVSAFVGGALILLSCYLAFSEFGPEAGAIYSMLAFLLSAGTAWLIVKNGINFLRLPPPRRTAQTPTPASAPAPASEPAVGEVMRVVQPLRPTGTVEWMGRRFAARSLNPHEELPVGQAVVFREKDSIYFIVEAQRN